MGAPVPILLVAYYYPPLGGIGSYRAWSYARHLPTHGFRPIVLTPRLGAYGTDDTLDPHPHPSVEVVRTTSYEPAVLARRLRGGGGGDGGGGMVEATPGRLAGLARRVLAATAYHPDHARGWVGPAVRAGVRAGRELGVRAVVSTSPPFSGHLVATRIARRLRVPSVVEFRDLYSDQAGAAPGSLRRRAQERLERRVLQDASAVVTVGDVWRKHLLGRYGTGRAKPFRVLRNAFEEDDFRAPPPARDGDLFRIVHTGTVYEERHRLDGFFRGLALARERGAFGARRPVVVLAGKVAAHARESAAAAGCEDLLELPGFVSHERAVELTRAADVNLLLCWETVPDVVRDGLCPGKMYEQLAAGRPILHLAPTRTEAAELLDETGRGRTADPGDPEAVADVLTDLARAAEGSTPDGWPRDPDLARFSRREVAAGLAALLASLLD